MSDTAFDTLGAARRLKAAGIETEQADAIVEVMSQSASQFLTVEHFDAGIATLQAGINAVRADLRAEIARALVVAVGVFIAANALMMTILGILLTSDAGM